MGSAVHVQTGKKRRHQMGVRPAGDVLAGWGGGKEEGLKVPRLALQRWRASALVMT